MNVGFLPRMQPRTGDTPTEAIDNAAMRTAASGPEQDHYSALARIVADVSQDHAHLRTFIYEFMRVKLRKDLYPQFVEGDWSKIEQQVSGLEAAIVRIEADFAQSPPALQFHPQPALPEQVTRPGKIALHFGSQNPTRFSDDGIPALSLLARASPHRASSLPIVSDDSDRLANAFLGQHLRSTYWRNIQLLAAALMGVVLYATTDAKSAINWMEMHWLDRSARTSLTSNVEKTHDVTVPNSGETLRRLPPPASPVPVDYGTYVLLNGRLTELEQLPIKVPDPRVAISASISVPSRTHLPIGRLEFVVFRRDLMNNAPDRIAVRVVAQVMRALSFDAAGKPKKTNVEQSWVIRDISYQMRVAPYADNPEMIAIRPDPPDLDLPAGRYALVLKGVGYDFTVDGGRADIAHCLERTDALNAPIFSECPKP